MPDIITRTLADSLAEQLPKPSKLSDLKDSRGNALREWFAVPKTMEVKEVDCTKFAPTPQRASGTAKLVTQDSFIKHVVDNKQAGTKVWCDFNPQQAKLSFTAVFDDHGDAPGWREHRAIYTPDTSAEWKIWSNQDRKPLSQMDFAGFLEANANDVYAPEGMEPPMPSSLQMLELAHNIELNGDNRIKSKIDLQGGGVAVEYINGEDEATKVRMRYFEKFMVLIPVFWGASGYVLMARLKYRQVGGAVMFFYEIDRSDKVYEEAARGTISAVAEGIREIPLLFGSF